MDRYFYAIEECDNGKVVHLLGNLYDVADYYEIAEWSFLYFTIEEIQKQVYTESFLNNVAELVKYVGVLTNTEAQHLVNTYFHGSCGVSLLLTNVAAETPCGYYYFDAGSVAKLC